MTTKHFNIQIRIVNADGLNHVINVPIFALSANHAKGEAQYAIQTKNPGCQTQVVDCYQIPR